MLPAKIQIVKNIGRHRTVQKPAIMTIQCHQVLTIHTITVFLWQLLLNFNITGGDCSWPRLHCCSAKTLRKRKFMSSVGIRTFKKLRCTLLPNKADLPNCRDVGKALVWGPGVGQSRPDVYLVNKEPTPDVVLVRSARLIHFIGITGGMYFLHRFVYNFSAEYFKHKQK